MTRLARVLPLLTLVALVASVTACTPSVGSLGSPATPVATAEPSLEQPSGDATPDTGSPTPTASPTPSSPPSTGPSTGPSVSPAGSPRPTATPSPTPRPSPTAAPAGTTIVRAYFVLGSFQDNSGLVPVLREVAQTKGVATAAMRQLLAGPRGDELSARPAMYTAIPDGTTLLGISIADGIATVNLSREFETGADPTTARTAVAQVVYTLTQFPTVTGVRIELDGQPVASIAGGSVSLRDALARDDFRDQLPAIFVDRPAWGASLGNPGIVSGEANVFEATFQVELLDAGGRTIATTTVTASCGTGCWGTFRSSLAYSVAKSQWGTLRVFEPSAKDGTPTHVTEYPVWLTPRS